MCNGTRSFETLLRYRGAAMAEFWRALKTLKALQAEQAAETGTTRAAEAVEVHPKAPAPRPPLIARAQPDEPERAAEPRLEYVLTEPPAPGRTLHEPAAPWLPNEPETGPARRCARLHQLPIATQPARTEPTTTRSAPPAPAPRIARRS